VRSWNVCGLTEKQQLGTEKLRREKFCAEPGANPPPGVIREGDRVVSIGSKPVFAWPYAEVIDTLRFQTQELKAVQLQNPERDEPLLSLVLSRVQSFSNSRKASSNKLCYQVSFSLDTGFPLGLSFTQTKSGKGAVISAVRPGGLAEAWNDEHSGPSRIQPGDRVVRIGLQTVQDLHYNDIIAVLSRMIQKGNPVLEMTLIGKR